MLPYSMADKIDLPTKQRLPWTEGLTIAIAPGLGYILAFVYQLGFADEMHIPVQLIRVELGDLLRATVVLFALVAMSLFFVDVVSQWLRMPVHPAQRDALKVVVVICMSLLPPTIVYRNHLDRVQFLWITVAAFIAFVLLPPVVYPRKVKGYWERARIWHSHGPAPRQPSLSDRFRRIYGSQPLLVLVLVLMIYLNAYAFGSASALDRKEYLTVAQTKEVVLNIYGENAVMAPYNGDAFSNTFRIVNLHDSPDIKLELRRIGPLRPDKVQP
jgi:hypothetical protein